MRRSIDPMENGGAEKSRPEPAFPTIVSMSLRLVIPQRVGLHQSPPPLPLPISFCNPKSRSARSFQPTVTVASTVCITEGRSPGFHQLHLDYSRDLQLDSSDAALRAFHCVSRVDLS